MVEWEFVKGGGGGGVILNGEKILRGIFENTRGGDWG